MPTSGQSQRNLILKQIETLLKGISVDNGDGTSPVEVTRELKGFDEVADYPVLVVTESPESTVVQIELDMYAHEFGVDIYGYVKKTETRGRSDFLEDLWSDVIRTVIGHNTLKQDGSGPELCSDIKVAGARQTDGGGLGEIGLFVQPFTVIYYEQVPGG